MLPNGVSKGGEKADRRGVCPYFVATLLMGEAASPPFLSPNGEGREYSHLHVHQYLTDTEVIVF